MSNEFPNVENIMPQEERGSEQDPVDLLKEKLQRATPIEFEQEGVAALEEDENNLETVRGRIAGGADSVDKQEE